MQNVHVQAMAKQFQNQPVARHIGLVPVWPVMHPVHEHRLRPAGLFSLQPSTEHARLQCAERGDSGQAPTSCCIMHPAAQWPPASVSSACSLLCSALGSAYASTLGLSACAEASALACTAT